MDHNSDPFSYTILGDYMDYKIVIDAGHGGVDNGATGNGIIEKDLSLKISNYIYNRLKELGMDVYITRTADETLPPDERVNRVLDVGSDSNVIVLSNHINAGKGDGAEVIYALRNNDTLSNLILNELSKEGQNIRKAYQKRLPSDPTKDYYFMLRDTGNTESLIIEYGFLDSTKDDVNQLKNDYEKYAEAIVRAILKYLNIEYVPILEDSTYKVVSGDTLWSIAKKFNTTVDKIKNENNLTSSLLTVGQVLKVPSTIDKNENIYIVKLGDTLYSISKLFDVAVDDIMSFNNLNSTILSIGQNIKIPPISNTYEVVLGDTLWSIAKKFNTTVDKLKEINNLVSDVLSIGQILITK